MPINGVTAQEESQGQENPQELSQTKFTDKSCITWRTFVSWISDGQVTSAKETPQQDQETVQKVWFTWEAFSAVIFPLVRGCSRESNVKVWKPKIKMEKHSSSGQPRVLSKLVPHLQQHPAGNAQGKRTSKKLSLAHSPSNPQLRGFQSQGPQLYLCN